MIFVFCKPGRSVRGPKIGQPARSIERSLPEIASRAVRPFDCLSSTYFRLTTVRGRRRTGVTRSLASTICLLCLAFISLLGSGCNSKRPTLTVLIWTDYIDPSLITAFEQREQCNVHIENYTSNDELKQILRDGRIDADIIVPSSFELSGLRSEGFLLPLDAKLLPNRKYIDSGFLRQFNLETYSEIGIPYFVAPTGLAFTSALPNSEVMYDGKDHKVPRISWHVFEKIDPLTGKAWAARSTLLDEKREAIGAALIASGARADATDKASLDKAELVLRGWCEAGMKLNGTTYQYNLFTKRISIAHAYLGDVLPLSPEVTFAIPEEGFIITCDFLAITASSRQTKLAHRFIDYLCEPKNSAANMKWALYRAPNQEAFDLVKDEVKQPVLHFLEADWAKKGTILQPLTREEQTRFDALWSKFDKYKEK